MSGTGETKTKEEDSIQELIFEQVIIFDKKIYPIFNPTGRIHYLAPVYLYIYVCMIIWPSQTLSPYW